MKKLALLAGVGIGYVLGTRAGRERYDQIAEKASKVWGDPRIQQKVEDVKTHAPEMASKVTESAKSVTDKAKSKVGGSEGNGDSGDLGSGVMGDESGSYSTGYGPGGERLP
jgi:hypothetical protein